MLLHCTAVAQSKVAYCFFLFLLAFISPLFFSPSSFNQLDLPAYESYEKLRHMLLLAIQECSEGFGLA